MAAGSYLLKRVAAPVNGSLTTSSPITYLGDELPTEGGAQRNFVVDPWTLHKTQANISRNAFNPTAPGAGNRPAEALYDNYYTSYSTDYTSWEKAITEGEKAGDWYRLGYTMENTLRREAQVDAYRTMVVFQARYTPDGYEEGETFYRVRDEIFPTREEAEVAAEGTNALVSLSLLKRRQLTRMSQTLMKRMTHRPHLPSQETMTTMNPIILLLRRNRMMMTMMMTTKMTNRKMSIST